jgi:hypothetical protein
MEQLCPRFSAPDLRPVFRVALQPCFRLGSALQSGDQGRHGVWVHGLTAARVRLHHTQKKKRKGKDKSPSVCNFYLQ